MAFSKAPTFPSLTYNQSFWSKALSHPARIIILTHLLENGTSPFHEIWRKIPLAKTTVSQHIRILRDKGLIEGEAIFPYTYYKLNRQTCRSLAIQITDLDIDFSQND
ncbi:MAG TPA: winged helix-turn-helix domain-containing protein [Saprospiraceae bacterium]|nr:winged helix-turn-helix domain-containing protein [Saprospiraceae bacterium]